MEKQELKPSTRYHIGNGTTGEFVIYTNHAYFFKNIAPDDGYYEKSEGGETDGLIGFFDFGQTYKEA